MKGTWTNTKGTAVPSSQLVISYEPDAIREHFDGDPEFGPRVDAMTDAELVDFVETLMGWDSVWEHFHETLAAALFPEKFQ